MKPQIRKTRRAWNVPGHAHFLTYSCVRRWPLLTTDRSRKWVIEAMDNARRSHNFAIWAYVIMPEHVHVLLFPLDADYEMSRILVAFKRPVSDQARVHLEQTGNSRWIELLTVEYPTRKVFRFWQPGGGFDRNLFKERTVRNVIDYIHANPIRRGLVTRATDWEWSSARFWEGWKDTHLPMDDPGF